ncbi:hypothetical protein AAG570_013679 [Ranatra chinensis]|uniref:Uncharacterized protein n=1 Tax=Ranatra chinensis TaxID=642074 RepID=A0ABD0YVE1_9HEMI
MVKGGWLRALMGKGPYQFDHVDEAVWSVRLSCEGLSHKLCVEDLAFKCSLAESFSWLYIVTHTRAGPQWRVTHTGLGVPGGGPTRGVAVLATLGQIPLWRDFDGESGGWTYGSEHSPHPVKFFQSSVRIPSYSFVLIVDMVGRRYMDVVKLIGGDVV